MIFEEEYKLGIEDVDSNNYVTNRAILTILEDVACSHSNSVKFGPLHIKETGCTWLLLDWRVKIESRPKYFDKILVKTWSSKKDKLYAFRDFEILDSNGNRAAIATSKWFLMDINSRKPIRITSEHIDRYETEEGKMVFTDEISKIVEPETYEYQRDYKIERRDIDMNNHMHNINYLDLAYEMLPEEVYRNNNFNNVIIEYKKEIKYGDIVHCFYSNVEGKHIITLKTTEKVNAFIVLY